MQLLCNIKSSISPAARALVAVSLSSPPTLVETYTYTEGREHAGNSNKHLIKAELPANTNASRVLCTILARNHGNNVHEIPVLAAPGQRLL